jgi:ABC-type branched-subunit amino acid transport system substrate-binding protein
LRARLISLCLIAIFVGSSCGSRLPTNVLNSLDARTSSSNGTTTSNGTQPSTNGTTTSTGTSNNATSNGPATSSGGSSGGSGGGGAQPLTVPSAQCAKLKSGAPGVTDTEVKVASIVTDSGPLPGATEGSYRGAASYLARVNAGGGVCGRKITILKGDDGLDPAKGRAEFERLEPQVFAFVGSFAVADSGYIDLIKSTGVPYVALTVDPSGGQVRNVMPKSARDYVATSPFVWWRKTHPKVSKAAMLYADIGGVTANVPGFTAAIKRAGFTFAYQPAGAQVTSPDYTPEVRKAQDAGVQFFFLFAFEVNMHVRMVRNMRQQNYDPPIKGANIAYNTKFSQLLGSQGDGWENYQPHLQFLDPNEPARSAALREFIDWNNRLFPGGQLDLFPVDGWGYTALFVDALAHVQGSVLSRQALLNALFAEKSFDFGGMETPVNPQTGLGKPCFNMAIHKGGHWVREYPTASLFECNIGENYKFR